MQASTIRGVMAAPLPQVYQASQRCVWEVPALVHVLPC